MAIRLRRTLGSVIISIANDGNLLTEEQTAHIFDKFYQGDKSRAESGYGLGLAIVKRIVELHGGTVSAKNTGTSKLELCVELPQRLPQQ